jgi:class 3 adenylate cyclase/pimeloyl-ACP methyl ester carboxylesterase
VPPDELIPETRFTALEGSRLAYQVFGEGPVDLLWVESVGFGIDTNWYWPSHARFLRQLGTEARVIMFDRLGTGASDPPSADALPGWEQWAVEARTVLDAVDSERAVLLGGADAGPVAVLFAATQPSRTHGLVLHNTMAKYEEASEALHTYFQDAWGTEAMLEAGAPDAYRDPAYRRYLAMCMRQSVNRQDAARILQQIRSIDIRDTLASVQAPTVVFQNEGFVGVTPDSGRYLADHIPEARFIVLPGRDGIMYSDPTGETFGHMRQFLRGLHAASEPDDRALAAILFTDIVGSTEKASALGDRAWRRLLESHDDAARTAVERHRGRLVKMTGDGVLATFDGPGRAIRCAATLGDALRPLGLDIRAGLHTGEVEMRGPDIAGIGVHIAARVMEEAEPGQLMVSAAVPMLVTGSDFAFEDRGEHELKGVPGSWRLFALRDQAAFH